MSAARPGRRFRLLLLSVGSLVGTAVLECIEDMGRDRFELVGTNSEAAAVNNFRLDTCYMSPPTQDRASFLAMLSQVARKHEPDLIIPCRDDDVVALAHWAQANPDIPALVGNVAMAEVIRDKWASYRWADHRGLPFARSAISAEGARELLQVAGLPLVAKPRDGFGSHGVRMLLDEVQLAQALASGGQILQEAVDPSPMLRPDDIKAGMPLWFAPVQPGSPLGLCMLDQGGCSMVAAWASSHVRGAAVETALLPDADLERLAMDYGQAAWEDGWRGLFSIQARRSASRGYLTIELAGRFMGGVNALHRLGVPVVALVLRRFVDGFDLDVRPAPRVGDRAVKQVVTHLVEAGQVETLRVSGAWHRS